jgi:phospholipase/lecithinase/hemolysin
MNAIEKACALLARHRARAGRWAHLGHGRLIAGALLIALIHVGPSRAVTITDIVTFDSSLSDTGNSFSQFGQPAAPYYNGRATNGLVWVEYLAESLGVPVPMPSELGGSNYAWNGGGAGPGWPNVGWQVDEYLSGHTPRTSDLFVLSGGQNNFYVDEPPDPAVVAGYMIDHVTALAQAGAANFLVNNLIPMGRTPIVTQLPPEVSDYFNYVATTFNAELASQLTALSKSMGINIVVLDWNSLAGSIIDDPVAYGFTNATDPAYDGVSVVSNPDDYFFWDGVHPTTRGHEILAQAGYNAVQESILSHTWIVPEPSTAWLLVLGTAGLFAVGHRRRRSRR